MAFLCPEVYSSIQEAKKMNILIIGGSGFIGKQLCIRLCNEGMQVVTVSRSPMTSLHHNHKHRDLTLDNIHYLKPLVEDASYIFHFASDTTPGSSKLQPSLEANNNILPTLRLIELLQNTQSPPIIYCSSGGAIYNSDYPAPYAEGSPKRAMSYYGAGKLAAEYFFTAYSQQTNNTVIVLRPANIYGPGQIPKKQFGIIPTLFDAIRNDKSVEIWGNGEAIRDYIYIDDFLDLCSLIIAKHQWVKGDLHIYNAGSGTGNSIIELCNLIEEITVQKLKKVFKESRGIDTPSVILNCDRAKAELSWDPKTQLKKGLKDTWQWINSNGR